MANTRSAKKAIRKISRRTEVSRSRRSRMRGSIKKLESAIEAGDKEQAEAAFRAAEPEIMRSASHGVLHKNTAARKISRLSARVRAMA
jgi:small subunit ribosomal protein S20